MIRYRNGREDLAFVGMYFPPKPATRVRQQYWKTSRAFVDWIQERIQCLPQRCVLMMFGDVNDDFGQIRHTGSREHTAVEHSTSLGTTRIGDEKIIATRFRHMCEQIGSMWYMFDTSVK